MSEQEVESCIRVAKRWYVYGEVTLEWLEKDIERLLRLAEQQTALGGAR